MVDPRETAHDAAFLRLSAAQHKVLVVEASGWSDYLVAVARRELDEASEAFRLTQAALDVARAHDEQQP